MLRMYFCVNLRNTKFMLNEKLTCKGSQDCHNPQDIFAFLNAGRHAWDPHLTTEINYSKVYTTLPDLCRPLLVDILSPLRKEAIVAFSISLIKFQNSKGQAILLSLLEIMSGSFVHFFNVTVDTLWDKTTSCPFSRLS